MGDELIDESDIQDCRLSPSVLEWHAYAAHALAAHGDECSVATSAEETPLEMQNPEGRIKVMYPTPPTSLLNFTGIAPPLMKKARGGDTTTTSVTSGSSC